MFCALLTSRYQVSVYRTNGPLLIHFLFGFKSGVWLSIPPNPVHCFSIRKRLLTDVCQ